MFILKPHSFFMFDFTLGVFNKLLVFRSLPYLDSAWPISQLLNSLCLWDKPKTMECREHYTSRCKGGRREAATGRKVQERRDGDKLGSDLCNDTIQGERHGSRVLSPSEPRLAGVVESGPKFLHPEFLFCRFSGSEVQKMTKYISV